MARLSDSEELSEFQEEGASRLSEEASTAASVPHRMQQVLISWVFIFASATLLLDFLALQDLLRNPIPDWFAELGNWFGIVSCMSWLLGFVLLVHWLHAVGATPMGLAGAYLKVAASVFFNLQPMTGTMNDRALGGAAGLWWSNVVGITFFHIGNLVACADFALHRSPGSSKTRGVLYHGNLPITGMWLYQLSTWCLLAGNVLSCAWGGDHANALMDTNTSFVYTMQVVGSLGLLGGSVVYGVWCDAFHNWSH